MPIDMAVGMTIRLSIRHSVGMTIHMPVDSPSLPSLPSAIHRQGRIRDLAIIVPSPFEVRWTEAILPIDRLVEKPEMGAGKVEFVFGR